MIRENAALTPTAFFSLFQKHCRISFISVVSLTQWRAVERQNIATSVHSKEGESIRNVIERCDADAQHKSLHVPIHKATERGAHYTCAYGHL